MTAISSGLGVDAAKPVSKGNSFEDLGSSDFLKLLLTQLTNQDPMEPTGNEELLRQISSIREIELSTTMTDSLRALAGQQHVSSTSSMIGQYVTGMPDADGVSSRGLVVGVRFGEGGKPTLLLSGGTELPLDQVSMVEPPLRAAEAFVGQTIVGVDTRDAKNPQVVEGVVTAARLDEKGEVLLELDSGGDLRLRDVVTVQAAAA